MSVTYKDIYELAQELKEGESEAHQRSSASRAYYACFHMCDEYANNNKLPYKSDLNKIHVAMIERYTKYISPKKDESYQRKIRGVGHILNQARDIRGDADYKLIETFEEKLAATLLLCYKNIQESIN